MRIARFSIDGNVAFGAVEGEKQDELVLDIIKGIPFADYELSGTKVPLSKVRLLPPVLPNKVVGLGPHNPPPPRGVVPRGGAAQPNPPPTPRPACDGEYVDIGRVGEITEIDT
ncbi:DUF2437 domain-containing protein, partial [Streptomyces sp. NPDC058964]|uniref:DUF2437 domain-containing protein n=1 Tax=Streptomyces sp. NPDC058964 TaxID=3346681 RepID=UPI00367BF1B6